MNSDSVVNYESDPVLEVEIEGIDYRIDAGKQGTALCISTRPPGAWDWDYLGEAQWDAMGLRCKALPRTLREQLSRALRAALEDAS
jgi:hypothetical protein